MGKTSIAKEFLQFLISEKKYWLIPLIIVLIILGIFVIVSESSALSYLIYTVF